MFLTGGKYCDFVIWDPSSHHVERILADEGIWQNMVQAAQHFHAKCVMPVLCTKYFSKKYLLRNERDTKKNPSTKKYCIC